MSPERRATAMTMDRQRGFTLIELMIVIVIAVLACTGVALSIGATDQAKLRSSCWTLAAAIRYAYSRAVTAGMTTRVVMDFEESAFAIQETAGRVVLNRSDETGEGMVAKGDESDEGASPSEEDAGPGGLGAAGLFKEGGGSAEGGFMSMFGMGMGMGMGSGSGEDSTNNMTEMMGSFAQGGVTDPFLASMQTQVEGGPVGYHRASFTALKGRRGEPRILEGNTKFVAVYTPHEPTARSDGKAYIYFFPRGMTEHAIIQLSDGDDRIYSVEVHPLTGHAIIHKFAVEPQGDLDDLQEANE